jgi:hypothetical protein
MVAIAKDCLHRPNRRDFLRSLASLGLSPMASRPEKRSDATYRFLTSEWEVRLRVQFLESSSVEGFHFRDRLTNRAFCISADGQDNHGCLERFVGAMAIARYNFRSRRNSPAPLRLREHVMTIDNDSRMEPPPPFERSLEIERAVVSDIQAFGYNPNDPQQGAFSTKPVAAWRLLRQDLYFNGQSSAFLILHWKHTLDFIGLVDIIPGDGTEWVR